MYSHISDDAKLNAFQPVRVPKVKDIFRRMGYRQTSQIESGQVADFSRNPLESFDNENRRMSDYYYDKYADMINNEESQKHVSHSAEDKPVDNHDLEEEKV